MKLSIKRSSHGSFPSLAWVANKNSKESGTLSVWCGDLVETGENYLVEGVWPGAFDNIDFDESELFYGSGLRVRGSDVCFVSSCSTVDRLWCHKDGESVTVSNSLPCLLGIANVDLVCEHNGYAQAVETIVKGRSYRKDFPVTRGSLEIHYFENLVLNDAGLVAASKPEHIRGFTDFDSYSQFLNETAEGIGRNAKDPSRKNPITIMSTVSRGYDSPVASILARTAGARKAVTIKSARSLIPRQDSGALISDLLGLECEEYTNTRKNIKDELWYWAANGSLQDMNFSVFRYPRGPSLMFTGFNGDMVWSRGSSTSDDYLKRKDSTGVGFCEHRLVEGVIHCPVPFWGIRHLKDIKRISEDGEMTPWSVGGDYDRPIPRRIVESEGVPRDYFGQKKSATTVDELLLFPVARHLMKEYEKFLDYYSSNPIKIYRFYLSRKIIDIWRSVLRQRIIDILGGVPIINSFSKTFGWEDYLFPWANQALKPSIFKLKEDIKQ
ncbi:hypothetical protein EHN06_11510 [Marinobacter sp. NP-4(2019)]|uniref:hypothetical protein n=1 Tax=Marinobacter sp. NP-4(2019) TaxID=2488665 RepID=UPI000FC3E923|nr:hypothetical protein [Marinobacter sp. NP-4(2019)]AZT84113.1 hypothetical protein EHN06_11510 [Marinobacter sp. NP-4(2019)]